MKVSRKFTFMFAAGFLLERFPRRRKRISRHSTGSAHALTSGRRRPAGAASLTRLRLLRLPRLGASAAASVFAAAFVLLVGAGAAQAGDRLVSNIGQLDEASTTNFTADYAQAFITGSNAHGYRLTRVDIPAYHTSGTVPTISVSIHPADATGFPGSSLGTLTRQGSLPSTGGPVQFTASGAGIELDPNTGYFVVVDVSLSQTTGVFATQSGAEDHGAAAGWSISDGHRWRNHGLSTWSNSFIDNRSLLMAIYGVVDTGVRASGRVLTIDLDKAIKASNCPLPEAFSLTESGTKYPSAITYVRCASNSLELHLTSARGQRPPLAIGQTVTLSYDQGAAQVCLPSSPLSTEELCLGEVLTYADGSGPVPSFEKELGKLTPGAPRAPKASGAAVDARTLTISFDDALDEDSVPAGDAFRVYAFHGGGHGAPKCSGTCTVAVSAVSVSGSDAVLTLAEPIPSDASVALVYEAPDSNPLMEPVYDVPVKSFRVEPVTVLTPDTAPVYSSASVKQGKYLWVNFNEPVMETATPGSVFTVRAKRNGRARTIAGTDAVRVMGNDYGSLVMLTLASAVASGEKLTVSYARPSANPLRDRAGFRVESFSGKPATNGQPRVESVAIVSEPLGGDGDTYGRGDAVRVQVTFDVPVIVRTRGGVPRLKIDLDPGTGVRGDRRDEKWAAYEGGSDTDTLTFAYEVAAANVSTAGVAVPANTLERNGAQMIAFSSLGLPREEADLAHPGLGHDPDHKVDGGTISPVAGGFWSAELTVKQFSGTLGCSFAGATQNAFCSVGLTEDAFTHAGTDYSVGALTVANGALDLVLTNEIPQDWTLHVGGRRFPVSDATRSEGNTRATWASSGLNWSAGAKVALALSVTATAPPEATPPAFQGAAVNGKTLTLTFDGTLDSGSVPAPSDFYVTVGGARRGVAAGGVAIDGAAVTLTLSWPVAKGATVKLRYSRGANPLRDADGNEVASFAFTDRPVTNITPPPGGFWAAELSVKTVNAASVGCWGAITPCSLSLTDDSLTHADISYAVVAITLDTSDRALVLELDKAIPRDWTLHVGDRTLAVADATLSNSDTLAHWSGTGLTWSAGDKVALALSAPAADGGPAFQSAEVNGKTLTLTFDGTLDARSVPAPGDFNVTVGDARRDVAAGGVAIAGAAVTLTLSSPVARGETVRLRYARGANPLRGADGNAVASFAHAGKAVTNLTPPAGGFWAAELTPAQIQGLPAYRNGCWFTGSKCGSALSDDSFTHAGINYRVTGITVHNNKTIYKNELRLRLDKAFPSGSGWTLHVGDRTFAVADATLANSDKTAKWENSGLNWQVGKKVQLALSVPASGDGATANSGPGFKSASISGTQLTIRFDEPLNEDSAPSGDSFTVGTPPLPGTVGKTGRSPRSALSSGNGPDGTVSGTGTASVDGSSLTVTLDRPVPPGQKVTVSYTPPGENPVRDLEGDEAEGFSGLPATSALPAPAVTAVAVVSDAGSDATYALGETIRVRVTFNQAVNVDTTGGAPRLNIRMDPRWGTFQAAYESGTGTANLTFAYTVAEPNTSPPGIAVLANTLELNGGAIRSASGTDAKLAHAGLGHDAKHKVNWRLAPSDVSAVAVVSNAGGDSTYALGETIRVRVTFNQAVNVDTTGGTPRLKIKMDPTWGEFWAGYESGDGTNALTFTHTVAEPNTSPRGIAVLANTLQANGGAIRMAATNANARLGHTGLGHNPAHKVDWRLKPQTAATTPPADTTPPVAASATVNWREVTVTFDEDLVPVGAGAYLHYAFTVTGGGLQQHPVRATASGRTVTMELGEGAPARAGRSYTIGYSFNSSGPLKDAAGNAVAQFDALAAENRTQPRLSVADAKAKEGTDTSMAFTVTLDAAAAEAVTVDYATADGTATAGEDYTAASGTLTFAAGERSKTVSVAVLDDVLDEGRETFRFTLSNAQGAVIEDGEATGTIINSDAMPRAWLARFGRAAAEHVTDAIGERLGSSPGTRVTLGGNELDLSSDPDALPSRGSASLTGTDPGLTGGGPLPGSANGFGRGLNGRTGEDAAAPVRELSMPELLLASSFHMASAGGGSGSASGSGRWSVWGRGARSSFEGAEGALTLEGDVTTATLGFDYERGSWLAGVALSRSSGEGSYEKMGMKGEVESGLTGVYPYARYNLSERLSVWGVVGHGQGDMTIEPEGTAATETDIETSMAAGGARGVLLPARAAGGFELALRADLMATATASDAAPNLVETEVETSRLRLLLEASRSFRVGAAGALAVSAEAGLRFDEGDAETGSGLEMGGSLRWTSGSLSVEVAARGLMAHSEDDYEEWGVSGSVQYAQNPDGRGFSMRAGSAFGAAAGGAERLWSQRAAGLAQGEFAPGAGFDAEAGYGFGFRGGLLTPYTGVALSETSETWRAGARWKLGAATEVSLEANLTEPASGDDPESGVLLKGSRRW